MEKITELLSSGDAVNALESAIRALPGGHEAVDAAIDEAVVAVLAEFPDA